MSLAKHVRNPGLSKAERAACQLLKQDGWTYSELSMVMEVNDGAIRRALEDERAAELASHAERINEQPHSEPQYDVSDCKRAWEFVEAQADVQDISSQVYDELRRDEDPFASVLYDRFGGSWPAVRRTLSEGGGA